MQKVQDLLNEAREAFIEEAFQRPELLAVNTKLLLSIEDIMTELSCIYKVESD